MKNRYILFLFVSFFVAISIGIFFIKRINVPITTEVKHDVKNAYNNYYELNFVDNVLTIDFSDIDMSLEIISKYLKYSDSIENIYNTFIDNAIKINNDVKMYESNNYKVFETKLSKDKATKLIGKYKNINSDITVKILFNKDIEIKGIDLEKYNLIINREEIVRHNIVKTALAQVGANGKEFWTWYGYNHRVEWCCVFISWVANQNGVLNSHIPKFIWVKKGVDYYKEKNQLKFPNEYTPKPADIIFFNWNNNPITDHVGFVEKVEQGYVYTIEGNVNYKEVKRRKFPLKSKYIYAYGTPDYSKE